MPVCSAVTASGSGLRVCSKRMTTAILVDSSCDLSPEQALRLGVHLLPQTVAFDGQTWQDHLTLSPQDMFRRVRQGAPFPTTAPMSVETYREHLQELLHTHTHVLAIHPSRYLSNTVNVAHQAAQAFPRRVTVHDSTAITGAMALQAERAARMAQEGASPERIHAVLESVQRRMRPYLCLDTTEFLRRSRRAGNTALLIGQLLQVKPILTVRDGQLVTVARPFSREAALAHMTRLLRSAAVQLEQPRIVFYDNNAPQAVSVLQRVAAQLGLQETLHLKLGAVLSAHSGPHAYGFTLEPVNAWVHALDASPA